MGPSLAERVVCGMLLAGAAPAGQRNTGAGRKDGAARAAMCGRVHKGWLRVSAAVAAARRARPPSQLQLEEGMLQRLGGGDAVAGPELEHALQQVCRPGQGACRSEAAEGQLGRP